MDFESKTNAHSGASEDAWREKVAKALKPRKLVRIPSIPNIPNIPSPPPPPSSPLACSGPQIETKLYLVKWKDLGYSACTWERPEHLKDDALIEEYHKVNDAPPPEAAIAQVRAPPTLLSHQAIGLGQHT